MSLTKIKVIKNRLKTIRFSNKFYERLSLMNVQHQINSFYQTLRYEMPLKLKTVATSGNKYCYFFCETCQSDNCH